MTEFEFHPLANLFPLIEGADLQTLSADIGMNGLQVPIIVHEGQILDGRNRYRAMKIAGVNGVPGDFIQFEDYKLRRRVPKLTPLSFVISTNLRRRHLSETQRAYCAGQISNMRQGERTDLKVDVAVLPAGPSYPTGTAENSGPGFELTPPPTDAPPPAEPKISAGHAADLFKVSTRAVTSAKRVIAEGIDALNVLVAAGDVAVSVAEEIAKLDRADQETLIAENEPGRLKSAAKKLKRGRRERELAEKQRALPDRVFGVI